MCKGDAVLAVVLGLLDGAAVFVRLMLHVVALDALRRRDGEDGLAEEVVVGEAVPVHNGHDDVHGLVDAGEEHVEVPLRGQRLIDLLRARHERGHDVPVVVLVRHVDDDEGVREPVAVRRAEPRRAVNVDQHRAENVHLYSRGEAGEK